MNTQVSIEFTEEAKFFILALFCDDFIKTPEFLENEHSIWRFYVPFQRLNTKMPHDDLYRSMVLAFYLNTFHQIKKKTIEQAFKNETFISLCFETILPTGKFQKYIDSAESIHISVSETFEVKPITIH